MKKAPKSHTTRKPPEPADGHAAIKEWTQEMMPRLQPLLRKVDKLIRDELSDPQYAIKWSKAYYGTAKRGWMIEVAAYDKSINVVFLSGSKFSSPPPSGEGDSRYIKLQQDEDPDDTDLVKWIKAAKQQPGWQ